MQNETPRTSSKSTSSQATQKAQQHSDVYASVSDSSIYPSSNDLTTSHDAGELESNSNLKQSLTETGARVRDKAARASERVAESYDKSTTAVGRKLNQASRSIENSDIVNRTAQGLATVGNALENTSADQLANQARDVVREHPLAAIAAAVGAGVLLARMTR